MNTPIKSTHDKMPGDGFEHDETTKKAMALAKFLNEDLDAITQSVYDENTFDAAGGEYMVLTDEEADQRAHDYIKESLWTFNSSFLASYCDLPEEMFKAVQDKCEGANDAILQCIEQVNKTQHPDALAGIDGFVQEAISADGRGHFMSTYDGEENEEGDFYIYRTN